jgi:hypothetical protein
MNVKLRQIEVDEETAALLEARAGARGLTVSQLQSDEPLPAAQALGLTAPPPHSPRSETPPAPAGR